MFKRKRMVQDALSMSASDEEIKNAERIVKISYDMAASFGTSPEYVFDGLRQAIYGLRGSPNLTIFEPRFFISLKWYDLWIGFKYDREKGFLYFCPLPCMVIKIKTRRQHDQHHNSK